MLTVFGSTALDTIKTPTKVLKDVLGGAATFASISASFFVKPGLIAVVGKDFPKKYHKILAERLDLSGLSIKDGKTFRYSGSYDNTLSLRTTLRTDLNVLKNFKPVVPEEYKKSKFVYLANNDPDQNRSLIKEFDNVKFSMCDTIDFWISTKRASVVKMFKSVDAVVINDEEAKLLTKEFNLVKCAKKTPALRPGFDVSRLNWVVVITSCLAFHPYHPYHPYHHLEDHHDHGLLFLQEGR